MSKHRNETTKEKSCMKVVQCVYVDVPVGVVVGECERRREAGVGGAGGRGLR